MADKFDSGHVVIPVHHPESGEVHNVAFPADMSVDEVHAEFQQDYEHPALTTTESQPTKAGALENTEPFRKSIRDTWMATTAAGRPGAGTAPVEAGFYVGRTGGASPIQTSQGQGRTESLQIDAPKDAFALAHSHNYLGKPEPSPGDIDLAKRIGKPVYLVSANGLYMVRPSDGEVIQVYKGTDFMNQKKKAKEK